MKNKQKQNKINVCPLCQSIFLHPKITFLHVAEFAVPSKRLLDTTVVVKFVRSPNIFCALSTCRHVTQPFCEDGSGL